MLYNLRTPTTKECMDTAITIYSKNGNTISNNNAIWDEHPHANDTRHSTHCSLKSTKSVLFGSRSTVCLKGKKDKIF